MLGKAGDYLPHDVPMMLLDNLSLCQENFVEVDTRIDDKFTLFLDENGRVPAWISVELMAQAVGVWAGYHAKLKTNSEPKIGFLLGGRQCRQAVEFYQKNEKLKIQAEIIMQDNQMANFAARMINQEGVVVAEGKLTTYQPNESEIAALKQAVGKK
ncbi:hypothetical protein ACFFHK_04890 [Gallibacterium trehalosifermentans]|uniref:3-hydroxy-fatty acyl-ACP dehydratase n=1 Tax=Gallibacterium trehalosifermentans TaxID=516935 RepID=A0ABV6H1Z0_9PAST